MRYNNLKVELNKDGTVTISKDNAVLKKLTVSEAESFLYDLHNKYLEKETLQFRAVLKCIRGER